MQLTPEDVYVNRVENGTYADILAQLEALGPAALANVTYGEQFIKAPADGDSSCQTYIDSNDGSEFTTVLLGQVTHSSFGTRLSAAGNHFAGPDRNPVKDSTTVKDVLVLSLPTLAPTRLMHFYHNQVATLVEIRDADEQEERDSGKIPTLVKECIRGSPESPNAAMDLIVVTLPKKYAVPPAEKDGVKVEQSIRMTKKRLSDDSDKTISDPDSKVASVNENEEVKIELGAYYPLHLLPDHRGPFFQQKKAKLVQLDIRDIDDNLVAPWNMYDKLRPGTLILVHATIVCWIMKDRKTEEIKKFYQLIGHSIRVMAESIEDVEERTIPVLGPKASTSRDAATAPSPNKSVSKAFDNFQSPSKKKRL